MRHKTIAGFDCAIRAIVSQIEIGLAPPKSKKFMLVAIAGGSGSGKSFLVKQLNKAFGNYNHSICRLQLDNYCHNQDCQGFPFDGMGRAVYDMPESYALDKFKADVVKLLAGKTITSPLFDKQSKMSLSGPGRLVAPKPVIIVEGLFAVQAVMGVRGALKVFIDTDTPIRIKRRVKRDTGRLHKTEDETLRFIRERVEPYYLEYIWPQKNLAHITVINND